jgi:hypothetical protein
VRGETHCMKAVAMITPAPKYRANRYTYMGIRSLGSRAARTGKKVAAVDTIRMTKSAEIRAPSPPLYSFCPRPR